MPQLFQICLRRRGKRQPREPAATIGPVKSLLLMTMLAAGCGLAAAQTPPAAPAAAASAPPQRIEITGGRDSDAEHAPIPSLLLFKGGKVVEQIVGLVDKGTVARAIDKHV